MLAALSVFASSASRATWPAWPAPAPDPALEKRIDALMARLSLEDKVGQIVQPDLETVKPDDLRKYRFGSVLNGGNSSPGMDEFASPQAWLATVDAFHDASVDTSQGGLGIPILWGVDAVHGHNNIVGATIFPHNVGLGAMRDAPLVRRIGEATAREIAVTGMDWAFAPTVAVARDDRWGRTYESWSEDPSLVHEYSIAMVKGLQGEPGSPQFLLRGGHVLAAAKHFLGDGGTSEGIDQGDTTVSEAELARLHAPGYFGALEAGVQTIMVSFSSWQGRKMHGQEHLLTEVLKQRLGFDGLLVSDWNGHGQVPGCTNTNCPRALEAGIDVFMAPDSWRGLYDNFVQQAKSGELSTVRLDDAVRRILRVKMRAGLFEAGRPSSRKHAGEWALLGAPAHRAIAREAVRKSLVLLKNEGGVLPIRPGANVLVAGDGANDIAKQSGGWTINWQGTGLTNARFPGATSIYEGLRIAIEAAGGQAALNVEGRYETKPDVAIVVYGENPYAEYQGDLTNLEFSPGHEGERTLLKSLRAAGIPVVSVFLSGRPLWMNREINASDAFVAAWLPGSEGAGIADVLVAGRDGRPAHDFHGKLSFSWPARADQVVNRGDTNETPLFPFGYGLSYAKTAPVGVLAEAPGQGLLRTDANRFHGRGRAMPGWRVQTRGLLSVEATDRAAQEDSLALTWTGQEPASLTLIGNTPIDIVRGQLAESALVFDFRVDERPTHPVKVGFECGAKCAPGVDVSAVLATAKPGEWRRLAIPLACFAKDADLTRVTTAFVLTTTAPAKLSIGQVGIGRGDEARRDRMDCAR